MFAEVCQVEGKEFGRDIGTPSSTFLRELTDGLTRFCSIREISPLVTTGAAGQLTLREAERRPDAAQRAPTSIVMALWISLVHWKKSPAALFRTVAPFPPPARAGQKA